MRNIYQLYISGRSSFVFWGHLGLGDQICTAKLLEHWAAAGVEVHVPCKSKNLDNLRALFSYLKGVHFHPISDDPRDEHDEVRGLAKKLGLPVIDSGRHCLAFIQEKHPRDGLNVCLMTGAGFRTKGLYSSRFRNHVLSLPQISPPESPYIFFHERTSAGTKFIPSQAKRANGLVITTESSDRKLFEHARLLDNAEELHSVGSAFLCLALVLGAQARIKTLWGEISLKSDDPGGEWAMGLLRG